MKRFTVESIHDGTDVAVCIATQDDIDSGWSMSYEEAVELARKSALEYKCRWFDFSNG